MLNIYYLINNQLFPSFLLSTALEPRICTRWDIQRYAREAYDMGVRYIGGCCGFEPYHIRAIGEEVNIVCFADFVRYIELQWLDYNVLD